jgi:hypothetical protein
MSNPQTGRAFRQLVSFVGYVSQLRMNNIDQRLAIQFSQIDTWTDYVLHLHRYTKILYGPLFRGQGNKFRTAGCTDSGWRLEPSLYRKPKTSHPRFIDCVKAILTDTKCQNLIAKAVGRNLNKDVDKDRELFIGLMRHLGLPTPLIDWSKNPFIAAYFAFKNIHKATDKVSIFLFDQKAWLTNQNPLTSRDLHILKLQELEHVIPRQKAQESVYIYSRTEKVYNELIGDEFEGNDYFIAYCTLSIHDREKALDDLRKMDIYHDKLFPDEIEVEGMKKSMYDAMKDLLNFNNST